MSALTSMTAEIKPQQKQRINCGKYYGQKKKLKILRAVLFYFFCDTTISNLLFTILQCSIFSLQNNKKMNLNITQRKDFKNTT